MCASVMRFIFIIIFFFLVMVVVREGRGGGCSGLSSGVTSVSVAPLGDLKPPIFPILTQLHSPKAEKRE